MIEYKVQVEDNGDRRWFHNSKLHREDGPAIEQADGTCTWLIDGKTHREDGPAVECAAGDRFWYRNGEPHRDDGPAIVYANGDQMWYLNGNRLTEAEFLDRMKPAPQELTVAEIEQLLGYSIKVVK